MGTLEGSVRWAPLEAWDGHLWNNSVGCVLKAFKSLAKSIQCHFSICREDQPCPAFQERQAEVLPSKTNGGRLRRAPWLHQVRVRSIMRGLHPDLTHHVPILRLDLTQESTRAPVTPSKSKKPSKKQRRVGAGAKVTPHSRKPRPKPCRVEEAPAIRAARQRAIAADIVHELPPVGPVRFDTFEEFEHYVSEYFAKLYGGYRRRSSLSTLARNK
jgi:hypothetical protein